jgi:hypothetical protein
MPQTLDPFLAVIDAAFDAADEEVDVEDDEPSTSLVEYLASAKRRRPSHGDEAASRR